MATVNKTKKAPAKKVAKKPVKKKVVAADILKTAPLTAEAAALLTPEQVTEYNQAEQAKLTARKKAQAQNREGIDKKSANQRNTMRKKGCYKF